MSVRVDTVGIVDAGHPDQDTPALSGEAARHVIEKIAGDSIRAFQSTIDLATGEYLDDPYAQNKSLSEHVAADYRGRCVIELIQNGNDAHPDERPDGEIEVLLADEGPFGTVYVANRGLPFFEEAGGCALRNRQIEQAAGRGNRKQGVGLPKR